MSESSDTQVDVAGWLDGARVATTIRRPVGDVWDFLLDIEQTPTWRTHLGTVSWADAGPPRVGSDIDVTTSLLWYRNVHMTCRVTHLDPKAGLFAYRVVEGPATTENQYRVTPASTGTRFVMQGRLLLDSWLMKLTGPALKFAEDRLARREVDRLKHMLEAN
jgi:uncharacterized membrane protein